MFRDTRLKKVPFLNFAAQFELEREAILGAVTRVFERGDFILGKEVEAFEQDFARICNARHAIGVANGTDALIMALRALGIGPGDEVITASNSWVSSASAVALLGATPVFADVNDDQNISPDAIEAAITSKTKAIMPVHLTGRCADLPRILKLAGKYGLPVVEDAAQSVTARIGDLTAGSAGTIGCFSLHPLKNLNAAGDAGVITTNDDKLAATLRLLGHHGLKNREEIVRWGYNSRLDTLQAAILRTRIPRLESVIQKRRTNAERYTRLLKDVVACPVERAGEWHTYHVYVIQCERREELRAYLSERGIDTKIHYPIPIHMQEAAQALGYRKGSLPNTERQAQRILSLPVHSYLSEEQVELVAAAVRDFYSK
ncbi:MAG: DegT/DnrJ/EryC1/StrS family aminotransferase [Deltaproteobacteria bacterium]|nr:DegT/DnrJ/EryC1/StrS family aminotransferase [Deltaproteobacteria bacterium]